MRLPQLPADLTDIPNVIPPRVGHWLAARLGLTAAYEFFCHHCPAQALWEEREETPENWYV